jgi:hypothetical protein
MVSNDCSFSVKSALGERAVNRRLEDRVRAWCFRALRAEDQREQLYFLEQLRTALREHHRRFKRVASLKLVDKEDGFEERRAA